VPANAFERAFEHIPGAGLVNMIGNDNKARVAARQVVGLGSLAAMNAVFGDNITGAGPQDAGQQKMWQAQGFQPWSVKLPGSDTWVEIRNMDPRLKGPLVFLATAKDVQRYGADPAKMTNSIAQGFGRGVGASDFMPTLLRVLDGGASLASQTTSQVSSLVPWYSRQTAAAGRASESDTKGTEYLPPNANAMDKIHAGVRAALTNSFPGKSSEKLDIEGRPVTNANQGPMGLLNPLSPSKENPSPLIDAYGKVGVSIPDAPASIAVGNVQVQLSGEEQRQFQQLRGQEIERLGVPKNAIEATKYIEAANKVAVSKMAPTLNVANRGQASREVQAAQQRTKGRTWADLTSGPSPLATSTPVASTSTGRRTWADLTAKS